MQIDSSHAGALSLVQVGAHGALSQQVGARGALSLVQVGAHGALSQQVGAHGALSQQVGEHGALSQDIDQNLAIIHWVIANVVLEQELPKAEAESRIHMVLHCDAVFGSTAMHAVLGNSDEVANSFARLEVVGFDNIVSYASDKILHTRVSDSIDEALRKHAQAVDESIQEALRSAAKEVKKVKDRKWMHFGDNIYAALLSRVPPGF